MIYPLATSYAIEALGFLTGLSHGSTVKTKQLAKILDIPEQYLGKVMTQLVKKKYIKSTKGPTGGFELAVDPDKITLYRLMVSLDSVAPLEENCVMGLGRCSDETSCAFHERWSRFKEQVVTEAQKLTLTDMSKILLNKIRFKMNAPKLNFSDLLN